MGMIESIRNRQTLLLTLIGLGMLSFLVPYDAVIALFGRTAGNQSAGVVNGEDISFLEYRNELHNRKEIGVRYPTDRDAQDDVWKDLVTQHLFGDEYEILGLMPTQDEFDDIRYGDVSSDWAAKFFYGNDVTEEQKESWRQNFSFLYNDPASRDKYNVFANLITLKRMKEKFDGLVQAGISANTLEGKREFLRKEEKVDFRYVLKKYGSIDEVEVSDRDIRNFYDDHKEDAQYAQKAAREIEYIRIPIAPDFEDRELIETEFKQWQKDWEETSEDSLFLVQNGLDGDASELQLRAAALKSEAKAAELEAASVGDVVGPYFEGETIRLDKVMSKEAVSDSTVKCRHILLKTADINDDNQLAALEARADSLKRRLRAGDEFSDLVNKHSEDPGSKPNGGEYEFQRGRMVKAFEDFCFENRIGSIGTAKTNYGLHLIEVLDQQWTSDAITITRVEQAVEASDRTTEEAKQMAMNFAIDYGTTEDFRNAADTLGFAVIPISVKPRDEEILGLPNSGEVVGWANRADGEAGDVSTPFRIDGNYIIAALIRIKEEGVPPLENVESEMRAGAINVKKAEVYMDLMKGGSLEEIAEKAGEQINSATDISLQNPNLMNEGGEPEPDVIGAAFSLPLDVISEPIKGNNGVWVIAPMLRNPVEASGSFALEVASLTRSIYSPPQILSGLYEATEKKVGVEDLRRGS